MLKGWGLGEILGLITTMIASHGAIRYRIVGHIGIHRWVPRDEMRTVRSRAVLPVTAILMMRLRLL
jgi:hypothetical protein